MPSLGSAIVTGIAAHLGRGEKAITAGRQALDELVEQGIDGPGIDAEVGVALGHLMVGDVEAALAMIEEVASEALHHPYLAAAQALILAACGRPAEAIEVAGTVDAVVGASYLDRQTATAALGLAEAQEGEDVAARRALLAGVIAADATDDRVAQALARLALAVGLETVEAHDAEVARSDAERHLAALDLSDTDWGRAYALAACPQGRTSTV
jgi:hypothetical protein